MLGLSINKIDWFNFQELSFDVKNLETHSNDQIKLETCSRLARSKIGGRRDFVSEEKGLEKRSAEGKILYYLEFFRIIHEI